MIIAGRGLASASVAISPSPFRGVLPVPIAALRSSWPVLRSPANRNRAVALTYEQFRYAFGNAIGEEEARQLHQTYSVPESGATIFQAATANLNPWTEAKVDSSNPNRGPLLIVSADKRSHDALVLRERRVQEAAPHRRRDRDRQGLRPRALTHDRRPLARNRRYGAGVRQALRLEGPQCPSSRATRPRSATATRRCR